VVTLGCPDDDVATTGSSSSGPGGAGGQGAGTPGDVPPLSAKATVKFKTKERLINDFQKALSLCNDQLCTEVGELACDEVHGIALGGVDAYNAGIYEPLAASAVTTVIAVDRIALHMCQTRAHADFASPASAEIFELNVNDGQLDPDDAATVAAITTLFNRIHLREPKEREIDHLKQLYRDIEDGGSANPAKDWSALSCYAILSMMESVFY
jgi:hypothetical protein